MLKLIVGLVALLVSVPQANAKAARCFTTDDGYYNCNFQGFGGDGSFVISAPNRPTFTLSMVQPGVAYGSADFGTGRNVNLPGQYIRSRQDAACWVNNATKSQICAW
jgi:hypothetical protein